MIDPETIARAQATADRATADAFNAAFKLQLVHRQAFDVAQSAMLDVLRASLPTPEEFARQTKQWSSIFSYPPEIIQPRSK